MVKNIWSECQGENHIGLIEESAWRLIESQAVTATRKLVDSQEEQKLLEEMLEENKPTVNPVFLKYHPLLHTPFRYPPLEYGSRFGNRIEPSLWYGSLKLETAMAEKAFYQFNFLRASLANYDAIEQPLTAFSAHIKTSRGINLLKAPFNRFTRHISAPDSYEWSQPLGSILRSENVLAVVYQSARDQTGENMALFSPTAFSQKNPDAKSFQSWQCISTTHSIEFVRSDSLRSDTKSFSLDQFTIAGVLPFPAN